MKDEKKSNNSHQDKSDQLRIEIESKIIDLDDTELLQFAMLLVQGALKKSQVCYLTLGRFAGTQISRRGSHMSVLSGWAYSIETEKVILIDRDNA